MKRTHEISITKSSLGSSCKNPQIEWETPHEDSCANIVCTKNGGWTVEISREEGCNECVWAVITCPDECSTCEPIRKKYCPCESDLECGDCEECSSNGLCESVCLPGQVCDGVTCTDCSGPEECPGEQECQSGKCACPPDRPILTPNGKCVKCDANNPPPACYDCVSGEIVPRDCPTGVCDTETDTCVECTRDGDCGPGRMCSPNNTCECMNGLILDANGDCVAPPNCEDSTDCGECEVCGTNGCIPVECPPGYVCGGRDEGCIPECDCDNPDCPGLRGCARTPSGDCGCYDCPEDCSQGCDPCYCSETTETCLPNPCGDKICETGLDCGEDCGCDDGRCVPCESLSCQTGECAETLGCDCSGSGNCQSTSGCDGDCSDTNDCGPGCGCYQGSCIDCSELPCDVSCSEASGCECTDGKNCDSTTGSGCEDEIKLRKIDGDCDLEGSLRIKGSCSCPVISQYAKLNTVGSVSPNDNSYTGNVTIALHKGSASSPSAVASLPRLDDDSDPAIAENEEPVTATYSVEVVTKVRRTSDSVVYTFDRKQLSVSLSGVATATSGTFIVRKPGVAVADGIVSSVEITVKRTGTLSFPNSCEYTGTDTLLSSRMTTVSTYLSSVSGLDGVSSATSAGDRHPILTWSRSPNGVFDPSNTIRSVYVPVINGKAVDVLRGPEEVSPSGAYPVPPGQGGLYANHHYLLTADCGCDRTTSIGPVVFCNPDQLNYEASECNSKVEVKRPFLPCDVNKFSGPPSAAAVQYELYLDDVKVSTWTWSNQANAMVSATGSSIFTTYRKPDGSSAKEVRLVQTADSQGICEQVYSLPASPEVELEYDVDCSTQGYKINIPVGQGVTQISNLTAQGGTAIRRPSFYEVTAVSGVPVSVEMLMTNGCTITRVFNEDCCSSLSVTIKDNAKACSSEVRLEAVDGSGVAHSNVRWVLPGGGRSTVNPLILQGPAPGQYRAQVGDESCFDSDTYDVVVPLGDFDLVAPESIEVCSGSSADIVIEASNGVLGAGATINYDVIVSGNATPGSITLDGSGRAVIPGVSTQAEYVFKEAVLNGCQKPLTIVTSVEIVTGAEAVLSLSETSICRGDQVEVTVTGSPNAVVTIAGYGNITIPASGVTSFTDAPQSTRSYAVTAIALGDCSGTSGNVVSVAVTTRPATPSIVSADCDPSGAQLTIVASSFTSVIGTTAQGQAVALTPTGNTVLVSRVDYTSVTFYNQPSAGCRSELVYAIGECTYDELDATLEGVQICASDMATLEVTPPTVGSGNYSYVWSTGATGPTLTVTPGATTTYEVVVTDNVTGNTQTLSATVIVATTTPVLIDVPGDVIDICLGTPKSMSILNPQAGTTYQWIQDGQVVHTGTSYTIGTTPATGSYDFKVVGSRAGGSCQSESQVYILMVHELNYTLEEFCDPNGAGYIVIPTATSAATDWIEFVYEKLPLGATPPVSSFVESGSSQGINLIVGEEYRVSVYPSEFGWTSNGPRNRRQCVETFGIVATCAPELTLSLVEGQVYANLAEGCPNPIFSWKKDGVLIPNVNTRGIQVYNFSTGVYADGNYEVSVTCNGSEPGTANVNLHDVQIEEVTVQNDSSASVPGLRVAISGTCPSNEIVWKKDGVVISERVTEGDNTEIFVTGNGNYRVDVTCSGGFTIGKSIFINQ